MKFHPLCTHLETYELDCLADASSIIHLNQSSTRDHQVLLQHHHRAQTTNAETGDNVSILFIGNKQSHTFTIWTMHYVLQGWATCGNFSPAWTKKKTKTNERPGFCCISPAKNSALIFYCSKIIVSTGWLKKFLIEIKMSSGGRFQMISNQSSRWR